MIRRATAADAAALADLLLTDFLARVGPGFPEPDADLVRAWVRGLVSGGLVLVAERAGELVGSLALERDAFPWARAAFISERWFHVRRDAGAGRIGHELRQAARAIASRLGLPFYLGDLTGSRALLKSEWHRRAGGVVLGAMVRFDPAGQTRP